MIKLSALFLFSVAALLTLRIASPSESQLQPRLVMPNPSGTRFVDFCFTSRGFHASTQDYHIYSYLGFELVRKYSPPPAYRVTRSKLPGSPILIPYIECNRDIVLLYDEENGVTIFHEGNFVDHLLLDNLVGRIAAISDILLFTRFMENFAVTGILSTLYSYSFPTEREFAVIYTASLPDKDYRTVGEYLYYNDYYYMRLEGFGPSTSDKVIVLDKNLKPVKQTIGLLDVLENSAYRDFTIRNGVVFFVSATEAVTEVYTYDPESEISATILKLEGRVVKFDVHHDKAYYLMQDGVYVGALPIRISHVIDDGESNADTTTIKGEDVQNSVSASWG